MKKFIIFLFILSLSTHVKSEVTYLEILKDPTDLRLNLQYAKEQEALGEFKNVIATLERLTALYPSNIDLKLYLLSIAVKTDSTEKVLRLIEEIRQSDEITEDVKTRVAQVFDDINKKRIDDEKAIARQKARQVVEEEIMFLKQLKFQNLLLLLQYKYLCQIKLKFQIHFLLEYPLLLYFLK